MLNNSPEKTAPAPIIKNITTVATIETGKSLFNIPLSTGTGHIIEQKPNTQRRLKILEPTTLLIAISLEPWRAAVTLTATSGALVPSATIVKPIIKLGTLKFLARAELPSTKKSAPLIKAIKPMININIHKNIIFYSFSFVLTHL